MGSKRSPRPAEIKVMERLFSKLTSYKSNTAAAKQVRRKLQDIRKPGTEISQYPQWGARTIYNYLFKLRGVGGKAEVVEEPRRKFLVLKAVDGETVEIAVPGLSKLERVVGVRPLSQTVSGVTWTRKTVSGVGPGTIEVLYASR